MFSIVVLIVYFYLIHVIIIGVIFNDLYGHFNSLFACNVMISDSLL